MKKTVMRGLAASAAIAAVFALVVTAGIYFGKQDGLTEPAAASPAQITEQTQENFLGGRGSICKGPNENVMYDNDNWYLLDDAAKISDEKYITVHSGALFDKTKAVKQGGDIAVDSLRMDELYVYDRENNRIDTLSVTGERSELFDMNTVYPAEEYPLENGLREVHHIAHLDGSRYFLDGYYVSKQAAYFRCIIDVETQSCVKFQFAPGKGSAATRIYSDGADGVYADEIADRDCCIIRHCSKDNMNSKELGIQVKPEKWFIRGDFVYYLDAASGDYCKYDIKTGEKETLHEGYSDILLYGDTLYAVSGSSLYITEPDNPDEAKATIVPYDNLCIADICGDTVFMTSVRNETYHGYILYNTNTEKIQYVYDPDMDAQPEG